MLFLTAYFDESGGLKDPTKNFTALAGFVAPLAVWTDLEGKWLEVVGHPDFALTKFFHMKDFIRGKDQFEGWKQDRKDALLKALVSVIVESEVVPIGSVVSNGAFTSLTPKQQRLFRSPYTIALQDCIFLASYGTVEPKGRFRLHNAGISERAFFYLKEHSVDREWIGNYSVSCPEDSIPLQAADILAWEMTKEFETLVIHPQRGMRASFRELLRAGGDTPLIRLQDRHGLLRLARNARCPDQTGVEEVDDNDTTQIRQTFAAQNVLFLRRGLTSNQRYQPRWLKAAIEEKYGREEE